MIPLRPASLFRSRWAALVYAGGVLWFAMDIAGSKPDAAAGSNATLSSPNAAGDDANLNQLEQQVHALEKMTT